MSITKAIRGWFWNKPVYLRIRRDFISLRYSGTGQTIEDSPILALSKTKPRRVLAVGRDAEATASLQRLPFEIVSGFEHSRVVISDFMLAEKTLQYFIKKLLISKVRINPAPLLVIHPLEKLEGGLAQIEAIALRDVGLNAGARDVYIWVGPELSDHQLLTGVFKNGKDRLTGSSPYAEQD